ncbi:MAG: triose-phosphate isomerase, partial [Bacillota bacterium]|nr:triose-phosphate isomerase [Bacillota bacterium]
MRIPFIAGNWKMFKTRSEAVSFAEEFRQLYQGTDVQAAICAPFTDLEVLVEAFRGTGIGVGAQNVHFADSGAYTGEISAAMLEEIGVDFCIVGHSERRQYFAETDETVNLKLKKLLEGLIRPIMCVGESLEQRDVGQLFDVVRGQLTKGLEGIPAEAIRKIVIAYEPIWAIGTGRTASPEQAEEMCAFIRQTLIELYDEETADEVILQYGGSVKP